jgi:hypothetical protein
MPSSFILRFAALVRTDVSEERSASVITVTRIDELGTMLDLTINRRVGCKLLSTFFLIKNWFPQNIGKFRRLATGGFSRRAQIDGVRVETTYFGSFLRDCFRRDRKETAFYVEVFFQGTSNQNCYVNASNAFFETVAKFALTTVGDPPC